MQLCEKLRGSFIPNIVELQASEQVIILRQWRGYSSQENTILILYPVRPLQAEIAEATVAVLEEKLPKMRDTGEHGWDKFHGFAHDIERKYLKACAVIVHAGQVLDKQLKLKLKSEHYALCLRAKIGYECSSPQYALQQKDNLKAGVNGYIVYIVNAETKECVHRFFHTL